MTGKLPSLEDATRAVCYGFWFVREYDAQLAPEKLELTFEESNNHSGRIGWLIDHLERDVVALADVVWGKGVGAARLDLPWGAREEYESGEGDDGDDPDDPEPEGRTGASSAITGRDTRMRTPSLTSAAPTTPNWKPALTTRPRQSWRLGRSTCLGWRFSSSTYQRQVDSGTSLNNEEAAMMAQPHAGWPRWLGSGAARGRRNSRRAPPGRCPAPSEEPSDQSAVL